MASSRASSGGPSRRACSPKPSTHETSIRGAAYGVRKVRSPGSLVVRHEDLAVAAEVALDLPCDSLGHQNLRDAKLLAQLPLGTVGVSARVEVGGTPEVVLGLGRVRHFAADAREAEDADRLALVGVAQQVELPPLKQQMEGSTRLPPSSSRSIE